MQAVDQKLLQAAVVVEIDKRNTVQYMLDIRRLSPWRENLHEANEPRIMNSVYIELVCVGRIDKQLAASFLVKNGTYNRSLATATTSGEFS
jgi:hypothetical protein